MITVSLKEFARSAHTKELLVDLETCPPSVAMDYEIRNANVNNGKRLCENCDGTGNSFFNMYKRCSNCDGTGISPEVPHA